MTTLIDLNKLAPLDTSIKLGETTYKVPGDPPARWYLQLQQLADDAGDEDETAQLVQLQDSIVALVAFRQPKVSDPASAAGKRLRDDLGAMGLVTTLKVIGAIYADVAADAEEAVGSAEGNAPAADGTPSTSRKRRKTSASTS